MSKRPLGIYIHIPFCKRKCAYCDFLSFSLKDDSTFYEGKRRSKDGERMSAMIDKTQTSADDESIPATADKLEVTTDIIDAYVDALCAEIRHWGCSDKLHFHGSYFKLKDMSMKYEVDSIFIGGGTPSLLLPEEIKKILLTVKSVFKVAEGAEISMESNPNAFAGDIPPKEYYRAVRNAGVNRLSIGVQSLQADTLEFLGRIHTKADFLRSFFAARQAGFENINLDVMFGVPEPGCEGIDSGVMFGVPELGCDGIDSGVMPGVPEPGCEGIDSDVMPGVPEPGCEGIDSGVMPGAAGRGIGRWRDDLKEIAALCPEHISFYSLKLEEGTKLHKMHENGDFTEIDPATDRRMYGAALEILGDAGYEHYEISNAAMPGRNCRHNLKYWSMDEYLGFGLGAHSYLILDTCGIRFSNTADLKQYIETATRLNEATKLSEATKTGEAIEVAKASDIGEATKAEKATKPSEATKTGEAIEVAKASDIGEATKAEKATKPSEATKTGEAIEVAKMSDIGEATKNGSRGKTLTLIAEIHKNTEQDEISEYIFTGLRKIQGIKPSDFKNRFNKDIFDIYGKEITKLTERGLIEKHGEYLRLTRNGIDISNQVFIEFV